MKPDWLEPSLEKLLFQAFDNCHKVLMNPSKHLFSSYIIEAALYWHNEAKDKMSQFNEERESIIDQIIAIRTSLILSPSIDKLLTQFGHSIQSSGN